MSAVADTPTDVGAELRAAFPGVPFVEQSTKDGVATIFVPKANAEEVVRHLKEGVPDPYAFLFDMTAVDERLRQNREGQPDSDFTVVYHLMSFGRNRDVRVKVPLADADLTTPTMSRVFKNADWYEREAYDMFGIRFDGHPNLRRILMPPTWEGHPLRKEHPARATEMGAFRMPDERLDREQEALKFDPETWGMERSGEDADYMFLNLGPHHPGTHGLLRIILQLDGEEIVQAVPDIGWHHRGAEKMGERQSWHSYIPYTDRVDYFSGVLNNLAYLMPLEKMAGIEVPDRAKCIRVMLTELFRMCSHLVWLGTFAQDIGALTPVFYMFTDREVAFDIVEAITGGRMHPSWFRIGGVAQDLPNGWDALVKNFIDYMPKRLREYESLVMGGTILKARTVGIGEYTLKEAIEWGVSGAGLRACGFAWDMRKARPYSGYENYEFDIPTANRGDSYGRAQVRVAELWQSLRIIEQCLKNMPAGNYKADHPLALPPRKERTMQDIETLIHHFLGVSWGPVIPPGEACLPIEASKGLMGYYLVSDGSTMSYRTRCRTPSFAHMQMVPLLAKGGTVPDLMAILAGLDFILADLDR
jgi:NADH-quinone oxidoreductase subunit C/D